MGGGVDGGDVGVVVVADSVNAVSDSVSPLSLACIMRSTAHCVCRKFSREASTSRPGVTSFWDTASSCSARRTSTSPRKLQTGSRCSSRAATAVSWARWSRHSRRKSERRGTRSTPKARGKAGCGEGGEGKEGQGRRRQENRREKRGESGEAHRRSPWIASKRCQGARRRSGQSRSAPSHRREG